MTYKVHQYRDIGYDQLVTYCAFVLQQQRKEVTFEELVKEAFENFPERFKLIVKDRSWPDAALINKSWLRARTDKKWITGNRAAGFHITPAGKKIAEVVARKLKSTIDKSSSGEIRLGDQTRATRIVRQILNSDAFKKYQKDMADKITEFEFCDSIFCTQDSLPEIKQKSINLIRQYVEQVNKFEVLKYLQEMQIKFSYLLKLPYSKGFSGGMMRKKI